jgi:hypothetical protein
MSKNKFCSFSNARKFVHTLGLKNTTDWKNYSKSKNKPADIPANPSQAYEGKGWKGVPDWLGNGNISNKDRKYVTYEECQNVIQKLGITKQTEWEKYWKSNKKPINIPSHPDRKYKEWKGLGDLLGTGTISSRNREYLPFEDTRKFVQKLGIKTAKEWHVYSKSGKKPKDIPTKPYVTYKNNGWISWGEFLGSGYVANRNRHYPSIEDAKEEASQLAKKYNLKTQYDWVKAVREGKIPKHLPAYPWQVYAKNKMRKRK